MTTYETLDWTVDPDGIATLTLDRPDALNAFDLTMAHELEQVFLTEARDDAVRAVVVTGRGRAFCAGMDLSAEGNVFGLDETVDPTPADLRAHLTEAPYHDGVRDTGGRVTLAIHALPKPVIAAINGPAVGIGATMTLAMDLRLASTKARIGFVFGLDETIDPTPADLRAHLTEAPYHDGVRDTGGRVTLAVHALPKPVIAAINGPAVGIGATMTLGMDIRMASTTARIGFVFGRLGIVPEAASTWFLPRIVGIPQALEWIYSADVLTAQQAYDGRLVRSLHEPDELLPASYDLARSFVVDRSPVALGLAKQLLYRNGAAADPLEAHLSDSLAMFHTSIGDGKEGVAAFREKRAPRFTGRASQLPDVFGA